ncbi:MAG: hypothetical protein GX278_07740 [Aeromonadales bacterium]|nr:hypothetical protein [Aeromonadales bacterium]
MEKLFQERCYQYKSVKDQLRDFKIMIISCCDCNYYLVDIYTQCVEGRISVDEFKKNFYEYFENFTHAKEFASLRKAAS